MREAGSGEGAEDETTNRQEEPYPSRSPSHSPVDSSTPLPSPQTPSLLVVNLGNMPYAEALELQRSVARARSAGAIEQDILLLVEHPHVITLGRAAKGQTLTASAEVLAARGVELFEVDRGGDVTYHGPGQLVGYPIFDLKRHRQDLHWYLRQVEEALIVTLGAYGLRGSRSAGYTGVWLEQEERVDDEGASLDGGSRRKIASIGVHARDWVTWHGFALNVTTDLSYFDLMVPCGISGVVMTSIEREISNIERRPTLAQVGKEVARAFAQVFSLECADIEVRALTEFASGREEVGPFERSGGTG